MGTEAALKFLIKFIDNGKERIRRDGFSHRADLVDAFLRAGLVVFQQVLHGAVALRVAGFLIPGVLGLHMAAVMLVVVHPLDFLKAEIRLLRVLPELMGGKASVAVPVDILPCPFCVNVFAVLHIEPAVIVAGIIGAMLAGAPIVSCQFQTDFLLPAKMFWGRGRGGEAANPANFASGNTQYELTQASTLPRQGVSPLTRWGGCPQPANGRCPLAPAVRCRPCTPAQRAGCPLYSRTGEAGFHRRSGVCQFHRLRIRTFAPIGGEWIRNTPAGIAGQNSGCRPGIFP